MTASIKALSNGLSGELQVGGNPSLRFGADTSGQLAGFRNRIINGGCQVAQRGSVAAVNGAYTYGGADRICTSVTSLTSGTIQQLNTGPAVGVMGYCHAVQCTTSAAGAVLHQTRLEAVNTKGLNGKTITIRCKVYQDTGAAINVAMNIGKPTSTADTFSAQTELAATGSISLPNATLTTLTLTYTLGATEASLGLCSLVYFELPSAVTSKFFTVTDWQLEEGSIATPFEQRPIGLELSLCQRYYEMLGNSTDSNYLGGVADSAVAGFGYSFPTSIYVFPVVPKRANPTVTLLRTVGSESYTLNVQGPSRVQLLATGGSSYLYVYQMSVSAEL